MTDVIDLFKEQKRLELSHAETLEKSIRDLKHPMARVILESIIHDSMKHAAIAQALIDVEAGKAPMKLDVDMGPAVNLHQNIKQHVRVEQHMVELLGNIDDLIEDDRVQAFIDYLVEEEKRHHKLLNELSNLIDRDSVSLDEYVGLFQKYMIVPPE
jgi:rubrerythrin